MDNFTPDSSQLNALKTWYPSLHELHLNPRHPCIKLAGEAGELLDLYGKEEYKPNFSWWNCKYCKQEEQWHSELSYGYCHPFNVHSPNRYTPLVLDELGDYSYYLRILAYQKGVTFEALWSEVALNYDDNIDFILARINIKSASIYMDFLVHNFIYEADLRIVTLWFKALLHRLDCSLENLLELNYRKLNSEETNHGWKSATIKVKNNL